MTKIKYAAAVGALFMLLICSHAYADEATAASSYTTDNGIDIISHVEEWTDDNLPDIEAELNKNVHGVEMEYLDRIEIFSGKEPGGDSNISASYRKERQQVDIPINLSGLLPVDYKLPVIVNKGVINIFQAEERHSVSDFARDLSHEYGHHFTFFHFDDAFMSYKTFKDSQYYKARQLKSYKSVNGESSYEDEVHRWSIFEIAAEDYRLLLGSITGKSATTFLDISQKTGQQIYQPINSIERNDYNAVPQENWNIPLAHQVKGLSEYFNSFLSPEVPADETIYGSTKSLLEFKLPVLAFTKVENEGHTKWNIIWEPLLKYEDAEEPKPVENVIYTLVAFTKDNKVIPIKTVFSEDDRIATIGTVTETNDQYIYYYKDGLDKKGPLEFMLYIQFPDGKIIASEKLTIEFEEQNMQIKD